MKRWAKCGVYAVAIVLGSIASANALDLVGLRSLAFLALAPLLPAIIPVAALAGGMHGIGGSMKWNVVIGLLATGVWWVACMLWGQWTARRSRGDRNGAL